ncbi:MAG: DsbA family protein [Brevundimonas sp.]|nr:MAG: DsbA family protein [Brevundimonas sp.]
MSTRRTLLVLAGALSLLAACNNNAKPAEGDMGLGAAEGAKVTVVEYASVTCPHCAAWQAKTWPALKTRYVDTGKVRYVFRELPTPPVDAAAAGFQIARCAGEDKYFDVVHALMASQQMLVSQSPQAWLAAAAEGAGLGQDRVAACLNDTAAIAALEGRIRAARDAGVSGTPAFFVNGKAVISPGGEGASIEDLSTAIEAELAK